MSQKAFRDVLSEARPSEAINTLAGFIDRKLSRF